MKRIKIEETDSWQRPIISISNNGTATKGYRYIVGASPTGEFSGLTTNSIATYDGSAWLEDIPEAGWMVYDLDQELILIYEASTWVEFTSGEANTASNVGTGGGEVFKEKSGVDLVFKTIKAGTNVTISNDTNEVTINASGGGSAFDDSEAQTYFAALGTPLSSTQEDRISALVLSLKSIFSTNDLTTVFDSFYLLANETQEAAVLNLIKRVHDCTEINSPTWTQYQGYTFNGTNNYLNSNYNPSTSRVTFNLTDAAFGYYNRTDVSVCSMGGETAASDRTNVLITGNAAYLRLFNSSALNVSMPDNSGFIILQRYQDFVNYNRNGSYIGGSVVISPIAPNVNLFIGANNNNGTPDNLSSGQYAIAFTGKHFSPSQVISLTNAVETYMDAMGTGIL